MASGAAAWDAAASFVTDRVEQQVLPTPAGFLHDVDGAARHAVCTLMK
jgi:hypothetical protein